jgi:hypothetical protein
MAAFWWEEAAEAVESRVVPGNQAGMQGPNARASGEWLARELPSHSILRETKAPAAPTTKDFTTCSFLERFLAKRAE